MAQFILNVIHRPEMMPEYSATVTGHGKEEFAGETVLKTESLEIFKTQQRIAHENGLKVTIHMTYASLFCDEAVELALHDREAYGDEIALSLLGLPCRQFWEKYGTKDFCIWMFSMEDKKAIVRDVFELFREKFGFYPESTGSYYMDAELINYIKEAYPGVKCAIATCFEEGPKAYHTCNNSWYTFFDGGPWAPWIPSKQNTHAPAADEEEDAGIVAIPHLSRDLIACYDGNGSNFGTHPQNVLRGMIYDTETWEYPYLYNLIDQYENQAKYNDGYAYNMMFVGPGWMNKAGRWEAPYELLEKSYSDCCAYYGKLKKAGRLIDMTMSEFAQFYRKKKKYTEPECALWRDILYGSEKQLFWYCDPYMRVCINMDQGGAIVDLRPYAAKLEWPVGIGTKHVQDASYPFLIQEKYRAGYFTHYAGEGSIKSARLIYGQETADLCLCRTKAHFSLKDKCRMLTLDPVEIEFFGLKLSIETRICFEEGASAIRIEREILSVSDPEADVCLDEYMTACYGTTEYPEDMRGIVLSCKGEKEEKKISYEYRCREESLPGAAEVRAVIPAIKTGVYMSFSARTRRTDAGNKKEEMTQTGANAKTSEETDAEASAPLDAAVGYIREGYAFSPMFTLGYKKKIREGEVCITWLRLARED